MYFIPKEIIAISGRLSRHDEMSFRTYYRGNQPIIQRYAIINPFRGTYSEAVQAVRRRLAAANAYAQEDYNNPVRRRRWTCLMKIHNVAAARLRNTLGLNPYALNKHNDPTHELRDYNMLYYYITAFYARAMALAERERTVKPLRLVVEDMISAILTDYQPIIHKLNPYLPPVTPSDAQIFSNAPFLTFLALQHYIYIIMSKHKNKLAT